MDCGEINAIVEEEEENWMSPIIRCLEKGTWPEDENAARALRMKISQYVMEEGVLSNHYLRGHASDLWALPSQLRHKGNSHGRMFGLKDGVKIKYHTDKYYSCTSSSKWPSRKSELEPRRRHKDAPGKRKERLGG
ncbi:hypothetical protein Tco_0517982 [Tanacetum coccineum]